MDHEKSKSIFFIIASVCICVLTAAVVFLIYRMMNTMNEVSASIEEINTLVSNAEITLKNAEGTLKSIEDVDFETLNQAIRNFAKVVEPLARMFGS